MASEIETAIAEAAAGPRSASVDGTNVNQRDLRELIEADKYIAEKAAAAAASTSPPLKMFKIVPGGPV